MREGKKPYAKYRPLLSTVPFGPVDVQPIVYPGVHLRYKYRYINNVSMMVEAHVSIS
jgi:hypothetical protein